MGCTLEISNPRKASSTEVSVPIAPSFPLETLLLFIGLVPRKARLAIENILIRQRRRICYIQMQIHYTAVTLSVGQGLHQDQKVGVVGTIVVARRDLHLLNEEVKRVLFTGRRLRRCIINIKKRRKSPLFGKNLQGYGSLLYN